QGQQVLDILDAQRTQLVPLVSGLASYAQWVSELIRIPIGDGTSMAAVKGLLGTQTCLLGVCTGGNTVNGAAPAASDAAAVTAPTGTRGAGRAPDNVVDALITFLQ